MKRPIHCGPGSLRAGSYRVISASDDDQSAEGRRIVALIDAWLESRDESRPNAASARARERRLHDAIKAGPFYGKILSFAGLNLWVDERTADGRVMSQEGINL